MVEERLKILKMFIHQSIYIYIKAIVRKKINFVRNIEYEYSKDFYQKLARK